MRNRSDRRSRGPCPIPARLGRKRVMRTSERIGIAVALTIAVVAMGPVVAFEGTTPGSQDAALPVVAAPSGVAVLKKPAAPPADVAQPASRSALQSAPEGGHPVADL